MTGDIEDHEELIGEWIVIEMIGGKMIIQRLIFVNNVSMYVCMHICCTCIRITTLVLVYIICVHVCACVRTCVCAYVCVRVSMCVCEHV